MATRSGSQSVDGEKLDLLRRIKAVAARLDRLFDHDPAAALGAARELLQSSELDEANRQSLAAGILIDAGSHLNDRSAVKDGTALFRRLSERMPGSTDCAYNLANGLNSLAELAQEPPWSPSVSAWRREARILYGRAASGKGTAGQRSRALTNDANLLRKSYRRLEAYDAYVAALRADPRNGVASSGVARLLYEIADAGLGPKTLRNLAARYLAQAKVSEDEIVQYAGPHALKSIRDLAVRATESPIKKRRQPAGYAGFVWEHRLALSLSIELVNPSDRFWDRLSFQSVSEPIEKGAQVPPVFGMWNVLKADFLAARWLAYTAASQRVRETGAYHDTLDYANYGTKQSLAVIAQRAAFDVLDKVAGFVTEYLGLSGDPKHLYFSNRWYRKRKDKSSPLELQPEILKELEAGNPGLVALADLASDLEVEGSLGSRRLLRHSGTHRFVVLHDMMVSFRESQFIEHYRQEDFEITTVETLQMCRAALTYLRELVVWRERRLAKAAEGKPRGRLYVPPHHWIRGQ